MENLNKNTHGCQTDAHPLDRPTRLKRWSLDLTAIIEENREKVTAGDDWDFRGRVTRKQFDRYLNAMRACGTTVELRASLDRETGEMGQPKVRAANYCHQHTICPYCAGRVQDTRLRRFAEPIKKAAEEYDYPYLLTFTLPPAQTWGEGLGAVRDALKAFRKMGQTRTRTRKDGSKVKSRSPGEWGKVRGAICKIELKRGSGTGMPHVHAHALVFADEPLDYSVYIPGRDGRRKRIVADPEDVWDQASGRVRLVATSKLSREWNAATGGDAWSVHVAPLKMRPRDKRAGLTLGDSILAQSVEVLKYATKFDSKPEAGREALFARDFFDIREATYSRRLFSAYGCFFGLPPVEYVDSECGIDTHPAIFASHWNRDGRKYETMVQVKAPLFPDVASEDVLSAIKIQNGFLGKCRRMRNAVISARDAFLLNGSLVPPILDGGAVVEFPSAVIADPYDMAAWERWIDALDIAMRERFKALRQELKDAANYRPDYMASQVSREPWKRSAEYWEEYVKAFIEILEKKPVQFDTYQPIAWKGVPHPS